MFNLSVIAEGSEIFPTTLILLVSFLIEDLDGRYGAKKELVLSRFGRKSKGFQAFPSCVPLMCLNLVPPTINIAGKRVNIVRCEVYPVVEQ